MSIESKLKIEQFKMRLRTIQHSCSGKRQSRLQLSCLGKRFYEPSAKLNIQHCACARLNIEQLNIGKADNSTLKTQNSKLKTQNSKLKTQNSKLKTQNSKLKTQNSKLNHAEGIASGMVSLHRP